MTFNPQGGMNDMLMLLLLTLLGRTATSPESPTSDLDRQSSSVAVKIETQRDVVPNSVPSNLEGQNVARTLVFVDRDGTVVIDGIQVKDEEIVRRVQADGAPVVSLRVAPSSITYGRVLPLVRMLSDAGFAVELR